MNKILTACTFCRHPVVSTEQWLLSNSMLFCDTCCKSFTPTQYQVYKDEEETVDKTEKVRYDNDEYKDTVETSVNRDIEEEYWGFSMKDEEK